MNQVPEDNKIHRNIGIHATKGLIFYQESEIIYFKAAGSYTLIHLVNKSRLKVAKTLSKVLEPMRDSYIIRIHQSYAINILHAVSFNSTGKNRVVMTNGENITVSRSRKDDFLKRFRIL